MDAMCNLSTSTRTASSKYSSNNLQLSANAQDKRTCPYLQWCKGNYFGWLYSHFTTHYFFLAIVRSYNVSEGSLWLCINPSMSNAHSVLVLTSFSQQQTLIFQQQRCTAKRYLGSFLLSFKRFIEWNFFNVALKAQS